MTKEENIEILDALYECLLEFSDEGSFVYVCKYQGATSITEYDKLLATSGNKGFGLESVITNGRCSSRSKYESEGKFRFGIMSHE
jgi:hypothetical protein